MVNRTRDVGKFLEGVRGKIPSERVFCDLLRRFAFGTDASFYRYIPAAVVKVESEDDVVFLFEAANHTRVPLTFRASGTSLSGQTVTDSIIVQMGRSWRGIEILQEGEVVRVQPGALAGDVNDLLSAYGRRLGPDPASVAAASVGGIAANNASGMLSGIDQDSYHTLRSMKVILADGTRLDTGSSASREAFTSTHRPLLKGLVDLRRRVLSKPQLVERIRRKYIIKNTTGYAICSLLDFEDPIDILAHIMIGSEGTIGFISELTLTTVAVDPLRAVALAYFASVEDACAAAVSLRDSRAVAMELIDAAGLRTAPERVSNPNALAALLIEVRSQCVEDLQKDILDISQILRGCCVSMDEFSDDPSVCEGHWKLRKGLLPAVGALRRPGTTVLIEDVSFHEEHFAAGIAQLQRLLASHGYSDAIFFGHARDGNLHFVFAQDFSSVEEVQRYERLMQGVVEIVVDRYGGSLKAEHGTGRNIAPFVEHEWGADAYAVMWEIKRIFDPAYILNPGVLLSTNPNSHIENLKPFPQAHPAVDKCIECGFCEPMCPSRDLTLTPRQRITVWREICRLEQESGSASRILAHRLRADFAYQGLNTCAVDGLCALSCPVAISTGDLTRALRATRARRWQWVGLLLSVNFQHLSALARGGLTGAYYVRRLVGAGIFGFLSRWARKISCGRLYAWNRAIPGPTGRSWREVDTASESFVKKVVYFPACGTRVFGPGQGVDVSVPDVMLSLLRKAGFSVLIPPEADRLCCGLAFRNKGQVLAADRKARELDRVLLTLSNQGDLPIVCDTSSCLAEMREQLDSRLRLFDSAEFIHDFVINEINIVKKIPCIALHLTCSTRKLGFAEKMLAVARACADKVIVPPGISCCGFAGDKGFSVPELNASALTGLRAAVDGCSAGYSNNRACEVGLTLHSGIPYQSIAYLVDSVSN